MQVVPVVAPVVVPVDIGNSFTKIGRESGLPVLEFDFIANAIPFAAEYFEFLPKEKAAFWSVCSVNPARSRELQEWLGKHRPQDRFHLIQPDDVDMKVEVESIEKLGRDRLVAAWQARGLFPVTPLVVIDAGTAVTIDAVNDQGVFQGGVIFPGATTMLKMIAQKTASLPDLSNEGLNDWLQRSAPAMNSDSRDELPFIGRSSRHAILLGIYQTQISTLERAVQSHRKQFGNSIKVVFSGGGITELIPWLSPQLKLDSVEIPDLVLRGCHAIGRQLQGKY